MVADTAKVRGIGPWELAALRGAPLNSQSPRHRSRGRPRSAPRFDAAVELDEGAEASPCGTPFHSLRCVSVPSTVARIPPRAILAVTPLRFGRFTPSAAASQDVDPDGMSRAVRKSPGHESTAAGRLDRRAALWTDESWLTPIDKNRVDWRKNWWPCEETGTNPGKTLRLSDGLAFSPGLPPGFFTDTYGSVERANRPEPSIE